jgi:predicted aspartyl protease
MSGAAGAALSLVIAAPSASATQIAPAHAPSAAPAAEGPGNDIPIAQTRHDRMTVEISIDGKGPYDFLIDTGAERTVISKELARELALPEGSRARILSMSGSADVSTAIVPKLKLSRTTIDRIHAPALREANIGARGMLGIDTLQSQRVTFDFERRKMIVAPSRSAELDRDPGEIVVKARTRLGRLVLVDARLDGEKLTVVLDTGSEVTVGNQALRSKLARKGKLAPTVPIELVSVLGASIPADYTRVKRIRLGGVALQEMPVAFAEVHPFKQLNLSDRPALLLGMDALRVFDRVSVDFADRKVRFLAPERSGLQSQGRMASLR